MNTPTAVLKSLARTVGCDLAGLSHWFQEQYGGELVTESDPSVRLSRLRVLAGVDEGESFVEHMRRTVSWVV